MQQPRENADSSPANDLSLVKAMLGLITRAIVRPYQPRKQPTKSVAIVIPLSSRPELLPEERVSLDHLCHYLGDYDKFLIMPPGISAEMEGFSQVRFPSKFFGSAAAHNRLLMWPNFYRTFEDYEYMLMYHLDSLVLSSDISRWCRAGFDYIGAPWVPCSDTPWVKEPRVGNGGFALMKIRSVLTVLYNRYRREPASFWSDLLTRNRVEFRWLFKMLRKLESHFPDSRLVQRPLEDWTITEKPDIHGRNNDFFWSFEAVRFYPEFKVAPVNAGLEFAFEAAPRMCFEMNKGKLPFGCHAWTKFDRSFWEPYLVSAAGQS
ncbi:MAG TPA: DUF5672 family protein [Chthoniobacterales bacterium]|nr:DUF5672 family protein [Chthoniobacterales bacterium]